MGEFAANKGPSNVNRILLENARGRICYGKHTSLPGRFTDLITGIPQAACVVISGGCSRKIFSLIRFLNPRAKLVYIMHGCIEYENRINHLGVGAQALAAEKRLWKAADRIVCVSEPYAQWFAEQYPQYREKIRFINNPMEISPRTPAAKTPNTIAVSGGNRIQKNNGEVCEAVRKLEQRGICCRVLSFGRMYPDNEDLSRYPFTEVMGHCEKEEYYSILDRVSLYVINSELESFGLGAGDALNCRCALLLSAQAGVKSVLGTEKCDLIDHPHDTDELADKIQYLLQNSNYDRLAASFDRAACDPVRIVDKLISICEEI